MINERWSAMYSPFICITHNCNLNCVYCYQKHHSEQQMTFETAKNVIDTCFANISDGKNAIEFTLIGGEPLIEFDLIRKIYEYTTNHYNDFRFYFYAATNGILLDEERKKWLSERKDKIFLRLSLDGTPLTHNKNRCNSYDKIDIDFFRETWPDMGVKMTLSEYSLATLAKDIIHLHSLGFPDIGGVNLAEGDFDWNKDEYLHIIAPQLKTLTDFYSSNPDLRLCQLFDKRLDLCEASSRPRMKRCGIGRETVFFDVDGKAYPCTFMTPMSFNEDELNRASRYDFSDDNCFIDEECYQNCYIYPICPTCSGANYLVTGSFKHRNRNKCRIQKITALFTAELISRRIINGTDNLNDEVKYHTINAIKKIRMLYKHEFIKYL